MSIKLTWNDNSTSKHSFNVYRVDTQTNDLTLVANVPSTGSVGKVEYIDKWNYDCGDMTYTVSVVDETNAETISSEIVKLSVPCAANTTACMRLEESFLDGGPFDNNPTAAYNVTFNSTDAGKPALSACAEFNGTGVIAWDRPNDDFYDFSDGFTVECTLKLLEFKTHGCILFSSTRDTGVIDAPVSIQCGIRVDSFDTSKGHPFITYTGVDNITYTYEPPLDYIDYVGLNEWFHIAYTSDGSTIRLYIKGDLIGSTDINSGSITSDRYGFRVGNSFDTAYSHESWGLVGYMNDLRLLTGQRIDICPDWQTADMCEGYEDTQQEVAVIIQ